MKSQPTLTTLLLLGLGSYGIYRAMKGRYSGVVFPIERPRVTLKFGSTFAPGTRYGPANPHKGVDLAPHSGSTGAPIRAPIRGEIVAARAFDPYVPGKEGGGFGRYCTLKTSLPYTVWATDLAGFVQTIPAGEAFHFVFAHFDRLDVRIGQTVATGQQLGTLGTSGFITGPHLHLELRKGDPAARHVLDPMDLFIAAIVGLEDEVVAA